MFVFNSWELLHLLRKTLPGMLIFVAFRPFSEMNLKHNIAIKSVPGALKMNMGRLTATQVRMRRFHERVLLVGFCPRAEIERGNNVT